MKQANIVLPPEKACIICGKLSLAWGRTTYGDTLCSKDCGKKWDAIPFQERFEKTRARRNP